MKRTVVLLALALVCVPAAASATTPHVGAGSQLAAIERTTEAIRHLSHRTSIHAYLPPGKAFDAALAAHLHVVEPDSEIALAQKELVLEGFLGAKDDYRQLLYQNLGAQVVGFYDPYRKNLYVRNESDAIFGPARSTIAHEYTHALQDQHFHLLKLSPSLVNVRYRNSDAITAHVALTEGDAVNTQLLYIDRTYTSQDLNGLSKLQSQAQRGPTLPKALQRQLYFPYTTGLSFVQKLYQADGMRGVDSAYARLPSSTYEIMHPSAYANHWKPIRVSLHAVHGFETWQVQDDDVLGAFGYNLLVWQYLPKATADAVTGTYRGDRYLLLENNGQDVMLLQSVWSGHKGASAAKTALVQALRKRFPRGHVVATQGATTIVAPNLGVYLRLTGRRLTLVYAPTFALAVQAGTAQTS
ncbi:MAG: hypothetical protein NVS2B16_33370 [Chloroflexota bacterium]